MKFWWNLEVDWKRKAEVVQIQSLRFSKIDLSLLRLVKFEAVQSSEAVNPRRSIKKMFFKKKCIKQTCWSLFFIKFA